MAPFHTRTPLMATLSLTLVALPALGQPVQSTDPQIIARSYLVAFFHGDLKLAAELTHPSTLATLRTGFLAELSSAKASGNQNALLQEMGIPQTDIDLEKLNPAQLFVLLTESSNKRNPTGFEAMKQAKVEALSVLPTTLGRVVVRVKISVPNGGNNSVQESGLELQKVGSEWKVLGSAQ